MITDSFRVRILPFNRSIQPIKFFTFIFHNYKLNTYEKDTIQITIVFILLNAIALLSLAGPPLQITLSLSNYNGYNISCYGVKDGWIVCNATGGTPPYSYHWSTESTDSSITGLSATYYSVIVTDAISGYQEYGINLTSPDELKASHSINNSTCYHCFNGSIAISVEGGAPPYSYLWSDGPNYANRSGLGGGSYELIITDANGCGRDGEQFVITEPGRDDWALAGTANSNPGNQFIGTTDSLDFVVKTNNTERFRIKSNGEITSARMVGQDYDVVMVGPNGNLLRVDPAGNPIIDPPVNPGPAPIICIPWNTCGNSIQPGRYLGTQNNEDLIIKTNGSEKMRITTGGIVGIGLNPHAETLPTPNNYKLLVGGTLGAHEVWVSLGQPSWPDYVFSKDYKLSSLDDIKKFLLRNRHLPDMPSAEDICNQGAINLGDIQQKSLKEIEELYLQLIKMNERVSELEKQNIELKKIVSNIK